MKKKIIIILLVALLAFSIFNKPLGISKKITKGVSDSLSYYFKLIPKDGHSVEVLGNKIDYGDFGKLDGTVLYIGNVAYSFGSLLDVVNMYNEKRLGALARWHHIDNEMFADVLRQFLYLKYDYLYYIPSRKKYDFLWHLSDEWLEYLARIYNLYDAETVYWIFCACQKAGFFKKSLKDYVFPNWRERKIIEKYRDKDK